MRTNPTELIEYFNGTKQSVIPLFQRRYSWTKKNWDRLWLDITELVDEGPQHTHFMGAVVSAPTQTVPVGVNKSLIIDGQQRLITISIILCALREFVDESTCAQIDDFLINRHFNGADRLKVLPTQGDRTIYIDIIEQRSVAASNHLMAKAFRYFKSRLKEEGEEDAPSAAEVMEVVRRKLHVVMINLDEQDDPYVIFESLNYLGEPLTHADLVRNYILMKFKNTLESDSEQELVYREQWVPMEQRLGEKLTTFLMHYGRKDGSEVRKNIIYSSYKTKIDGLNEESLNQEIKALSKNSEYYERFLFPEREPSDLLRAKLSALASLDVSSCYPLLLRLYEAMDSEAASEQDAMTCLDIVESYLVRRAVVGLPYNAVDQQFIQLCGTVDTSDIVNSVHNHLSASTGRMRWPTDGEFVQAIQTQQQYGKKSTPYILRKLEEAHEHREPVDLTGMQIEHVMPQVLSAEWLADLGDEAENIKDRLQHTLGNLTLTGYNPQLGNLGFSDKKEIYRESHICLNTWISNQSQWGEAEITARAGMLATECVRLWSR